jgi:penicillin-binding protein 1A
MMPITNWKKNVAALKAWFDQLGRGKKRLLIAGVLFIFFCTLFYALLIFDAFGPVPSKSALRKIDNSQASIIYAEDGQILGKYFVENRTNIDFDDLPKHLVDALVVTEDERFWNHNGVDLRASLRVVYKNIILGDKSAGGGSTLSQQLAKNLFGRNKGGKLSLLMDKVREIIIARRLESIYTKQEIIAFYLNTVPFGNNAYGIQSASRTYFNRAVHQLSVEEAATLVGMLKATTTYNPLQNREKATQRRNLVLQLLYQKELLSETELDSLFKLSLEVRPVSDDIRFGFAPHFKASLVTELQELLDGLKKPDGESWNLFTDGLRIYTAIDPLMQQYANEAVEIQAERLQESFYMDWGGGNKTWLKDTLFILDAIRKTSRFKQVNAQNISDKDLIVLFSKAEPMQIVEKGALLDTLMSPLDSLIRELESVECAFLVTDKLGYVKAWVGGKDFKRNQFDHVKARRHIGSTMKPFVYAAALECQIDPCEPRLNERVYYKEYDNYSPKNVDAQYGGEFSFAGALNKSINVIAVDVGVETGLSRVIDLAMQAGFKGPMPHEPGICLGAFDASLRELLEAYTIFQNRGQGRKIEMITHVTDRFGNIIIDRRNQALPKPVLDTLTADLMLQLLRGVVERGTGANARWTYAPYWELAGKTGTSQNYADGWFVAFSPDLIAGAWVGNGTQKVHFRSSTYGQSNYTALPIWGAFFRQLDKDPEARYLDIRKIRFPRPSGIVGQMLDCPPGEYPYEEEEDDENEDEDSAEPALFERD